MFATLLKSFLHIHIEIFCLITWGEKKITYVCRRFFNKTFLYMYYRDFISTTCLAVVEDVSRFVILNAKAKWAPVIFDDPVSITMLILFPTMNLCLKNDHDRTHAPPNDWNEIILHAKFINTIRRRALLPTFNGKAAKLRTENVLIRKIAYEL